MWGGLLFVFRVRVGSKEIVCHDIADESPIDPLVGSC